MSASVFPARAGMSRCQLFAGGGGGCVPRASGDEPEGENMAGERQLCSPRERG